MAYSNVNSGALFKNSRKTSAKQPDYTGPINIEGAAYRMAGWIKTKAEGGSQYLSIKITPDEKGERHVTDEDAGYGL